MDRIGLAGDEWPTYGNNLLAHLVVTFVAYFAVRRLEAVRHASAAPTARKSPRPNRSNGGTG